MNTENDTADKDSPEPLFELNVPLDPPRSLYATHDWKTYRIGRTDGAGSPAQEFKVCARCGAEHLEHAASWTCGMDVPRAVLYYVNRRMTTDSPVAIRVLGLLDQQDHAELIDLTSRVLALGPAFPTEVLDLLDALTGVLAKVTYE